MYSDMNFAFIRNTATARPMAVTLRPAVTHLCLPLIMLTATARPMAVL